MAVFLVTWNINNAKSNYNAARAALITHLQRYPHANDPKLETVWFVQSDASAQAISDDLATKLDRDDRLVVTRMRDGEYAGWLRADVVDWITARS